MTRKGKKGGIIDYFDLREVGLLEFTFALTPILSGYRLGNLPLSLLMWCFLIAIVVLQGNLRKTRLFKPLMLFFAYWAMHEIVVITSSTVNYNGLFAQFIYFISVFILFPSINGPKLRGSFNWVAIIAMLGLFYQWTLIVRGNMIHPLEIPGLKMSEARLLSESIRPSSFFMEPAAYVEFMILPLFWSLLDEKRIWSFVIILSIFLTTSTTGIILSFIMLAMSMVVKGTRFRSIFVIALIGIALFYLLTHLSAFNAGIEKIQNTDAETNVRLTQGITVVKSMNTAEYLLGVPYYNAYNYCTSRGITNVEYYGESVFMPTIWEIILLYGIIGLILYSYIYIKLWRKNKLLLPLLVCVVAMWFSGGYGIQNAFAFSTIFLLVSAEMYKK